MSDSAHDPTELERLEALAGSRNQPEDFDFVGMCYAFDWVTPFDWPEWMQTDEARQLRDDPDALATATSAQLQKLLTVLVRQDRFVEGSLAEHFRSGMIDRIVARAAVLATATRDPHADG
jgi:hypothetical protein